MQYYNSEISKKYPELLKYFETGIHSENKNISHCLLFWGPDITSQCELALEIARLLNCTKTGEQNCDCLNCKWIREQTHPAVKIYTRLDFKEEKEESSSDDEFSTKGKKNISVEQAKSIIYELAITCDYHRVYIFCDRDEEGNLLPLNNINFPATTSNSLLKTFEEPPKNTTFIFLTKDKNQVLDFEKDLINLIHAHEAKEIFTQIQNYMLYLIKNNPENKNLYYKTMQDLKYVEEAQQQISLTPSMDIQTVAENLCFKLIL